MTERLHTSPTALIVVDVQTALTDGEYGDPRPKNRNQMLSNIQLLLERARTVGAKVLYVQHREDEYEAMSPGHPGFAVEKSVAPRAGEQVFEKRVGDSFSNPELAPALRESGVSNVAICGMQSDMCVEATTRGAIGLGFNVTLPSDAHATYDGEDKTSAQIIADINETLGQLEGDGVHVEVRPTAEVSFGPAA